MTSAAHCVVAVVDLDQSAVVPRDCTVLPRLPRSDTATNVIGDDWVYQPPDIPLPDTSQRVRPRVDAAESMYRPSPRPQIQPRVVSFWLAFSNKSIRNTWFLTVGLSNVSNLLTMDLVLDKLLANLNSRFPWIEISIALVLDKESVGSISLVRSLGVLEVLR